MDSSFSYGAATHRHTGTAKPIISLEQVDLVSGAHPVVGCEQAIDAGDDDSDVLWGSCH